MTRLKERKTHRVHILRDILPLTHWPLGDAVVTFENIVSERICGLSSWELLVTLFSGECHRTPVMVIQIRQQTIIWRLVPGHLGRTLINFKTGMDKNLHPLWSVDWNYLSIPKLQRCSCWSVGMKKMISSHTCLDMWLLIHAGINPSQ